ncbi:10264_t:CDS:1, partial [Dentiscutata heterogama]
DYENSETADQVKNSEMADQVENSEMTDYVKKIFRDFTLASNYTSFNPGEKFSAIESPRNVLNELDQNVRKDTVKEFSAIDLTESSQNTLNNLDQNVRNENQTNLKSETQQKKDQIDKEIK